MSNLDRRPFTGGTPDPPDGRTVAGQGTRSDTGAPDDRYPDCDHALIVGEPCATCADVPDPLHEAAMAFTTLGTYATHDVDRPEDFRAMAEHGLALVEQAQRKAAGTERLRAAAEEGFWAKDRELERVAAERDQLRSAAEQFAMDALAQAAPEDARRIMAESSYERLKTLLADHPTGSEA